MRAYAMEMRSGEAEHSGIESQYPDTKSMILAWLQQPVKSE